MHPLLFDRVAEVDDEIEIYGYERTGPCDCECHERERTGVLIKL